MFTRSIHRTSILLTLLAILALTSDAAISAQLAVGQAGVQAAISDSDTGFRTSPVMFIENPGQWDDVKGFQVRGNHNFAATSSSLAWYVWGPGNLRDIAVVSASNAWGVGSSGVIRHWNGQDWVQVASPVSAFLNAVALTSSSDGWAAGDGGVIIRWDGSQWRSFAGGPPSTVDLYDVAMLLPNRGWAVGVKGWWSGSAGSPLMLSWDGSAWREVALPASVAQNSDHALESAVVASPAIPSPNSLDSITMVSQTDGWVVGAGGKIYRWNGTSWNRVSSPTSWHLHSVSMSSANDGWAVAGNLYGLCKAMLHWDGYSWRFVSCPVSEELLDVFMVSQSNGWAVGWKGTILHWDGIRWSVVPTPTDEGLGTVVMTTASDGWIAGQTNILRYGIAPATEWSISGRVTDASGHGIPGVTVWAGFPRATTTNANGNYTFTGLPAGTYTIRPENDPYVFSPESRAVTVPPSATSVNFTGQVPIAHVKLLYVPLNWQNTQAAFDAEADLQSSIFFDQVPLSACPEKYRVEKLSVAAQNFTGFTCSGDAIGSIREFLRQQGINAEDYTAVIGLAETSPCPPTGGQSNGTNTVWVTAEYDMVTAHELGHIWGLSDQYCSARDGMSTDDRCNDGDIQSDGAQTGDVNWLDSSLPCDCPPDWSADSTGAQCCNFTTTCDKPGGCYFKGVFISGYNQSYLRRCDSEDYGELGVVHVNYGACCLGNRTAGGGRSIMSFANVPGSRAFDTHDLAHLNTRHELNCDVVTASQTTAGGLPSYVRQLILDVNLLVHQNDSVQDKGVRVSWGRPTSDAVLQGLDGNYAIAVFDANGAQVWSQAFPAYFDYAGPVVLGEDYSDITYDSMDVAFRIPHACGMSELRLYHSGRMVFSKTLPTVCPIYLPLVLRSN